MHAKAGNTSVVYRQIGFKSDNYAHGQWTPADSSQASDYFYDTFGNLIKQYVKQWNGSAWVPSSYLEKTYNNKFKVLTYNRYNYDTSSNSYQIISHIASSYQYELFLSSDTFYKWKTSVNALVPYQCYIYSYNQDSQLVYDMRYDWDTLSNSWISTYSNGYTYNHTKRYQTKYKDWNNNQLNNAFTDSYTFDTAGNILSDTTTSWDLHRQKWVNNGYTTYNYNLINEVTLQLGWGFDTLTGMYYRNYIDSNIYDSRNYLIEQFQSAYGNYSPDILYWNAYINDTSGNTLSNIQYTRTSPTQAWQYYFKDSSQYNSKNQLTSQIIQYWDTTHWRNNSYNEMQYDNANGYLTTENSYSWRNNNWLLFRISSNKYDIKGHYIFRLGQNNYSGNDTLHMTGSRYYYYYESIDTSNTHPDNNDVNIYPNPASTILSIATAELYINMPYKIHDLLGRIIAEGNFTANNYSIDISSYSEGIYILRTNNNSHKFVVKR
jgi:hypothetical protein